MPIVPPNQKIVVNGIIYRGGEEYPEVKKAGKKKPSTVKEASDGGRTVAEHSYLSS